MREDPNAGPFLQAMLYSVYQEHEVVANLMPRLFGAPPYPEDCDPPEPGFYLEMVPEDEVGETSAVFAFNQH